MDLDWNWISKILDFDCDLEFLGYAKPSIKTNKKKFPLSRQMTLLRYIIF